MSNTFLEQQRAHHEDLERLERLIVKDFKQEVKTHKEKLMQSHRVRKRLDHMQETARKLLKTYEDDDNARKEEIEALAGTSTSLFSKFYDKLKEVREYHRKFPNMDITEAENDEPLLKEEPHVEFTGEEGLGRYLDLHSHHMAFINSKFGSQTLDYLSYVTSFHTFTDIPRSAKFSKQYRDYLQSLLDYLKSFYERTQPLAQMGKQISKVEDELKAKWPEGKVPNWEDCGRGDGTNSSSTPLAITSGLTLDLDAFESPEELETLGGDELKDALSALGLKCGGTPRERALRLFSTKGKSVDEIDAKLFAKGRAPAAAKSEAEIAKQEEAAIAAAILEAKVHKVAEVLTNVISDTRGRVEKKQAQTYEEMQAELAEAEAEAHVADSDEEDEYIYNPLKLPLGWDGKPIPYWLYKLHGLNQEFKCEICGNYSYWGRRAYEKHFKEWRHQNGMRALGIPNNKMFYEVTKIDEAVNLWNAIQARTKGGWKPETDEEFEDDQGNVYNKKTYDDMKRQGLI